MNFKSLRDLANDITEWSQALPHYDLVVGVPRSGILPATLLALQRNVRVASLPAFLAKQVEGGGQRDSVIKTVKRVLVLEDSWLSGKSLLTAREDVERAGLHKVYEIDYAAMYASKSISYWHHSVVELPRIFEWNWQHHYWLQYACVDIDGVLCDDPTREENDDGRNYRVFLRNAHPRYVPSVPIGTLVTSRLEKWRPETEAWLRLHGVQYKRLIMLNQTSPKGRAHVLHKTTAYKQTGAKLFVESSNWQAEGIAQDTGWPVLCTDTMRMYNG